MVAILPLFGWYFVQTVLNRINSGLYTRAEIQFAQNALHMHLDGALGDIQTTRNMLVTHAFGQPREGFALARSQGFNLGRLLIALGGTQACE